MPSQSIISSPIFKAVSGDSGAISATKTADCFSYGTVTKKKKCMQRWAIKSVRKREQRKRKRRRQQKKQGGKQKQRGERQQKNTQRRGKITVNQPESAPQAAATSTSTKPLQRGKNIVDRGNKRNKEKKQCRNNREEEERPQQHHRPTGHQHHRQLIYPSSLS
jgi:hypothetical protein